jgi:uncharacterized protein
MERKLPQPGFWKAVLLVVLVLGVQVVLTVPLAILDVVSELVLHQPPPKLAQHPLLMAGINLVAFGAAVALGLRFNRLTFRRGLPLGRMTALQVAGVGIIVLGAGVLVSEADNLFRVVLPMPQMLWNVFFSQDKLLSRIVLLVMIAPVTEELLFRGIILRGLLSRHRPAVAVFLSAFLFAALHCNPWQFLSASFLGLALGWFYLRTGSLGLCVLGHAIFNALSIAFTMLPLDIPGFSIPPDPRAQIVFQPWWLDLSGLGLLLVGWWTFRRATPPASATETPTPPVISDAEMVTGRNGQQE